MNMNQECQLLVKDNFKAGDFNGECNVCITNSHRWHDSIFEIIHHPNKQDFVRIQFESLQWHPLFDRQDYRSCHHWDWPRSTIAPRPTATAATDIGREIASAATVTTLAAAAVHHRSLQFHRLQLLHRISICLYSCQNLTFCSVGGHRFVLLTVIWICSRKTDFKKIIALRV